MRELVAPDVLQERIDLVEVYRVSTAAEASELVAGGRRRRAVDCRVSIARVADRLAERAAASGTESATGRAALRAAAI